MLDHLSSRNPNIAEKVSAILNREQFQRSRESPFEVRLRMCRSTTSEAGLALIPMQNLRQLIQDKTYLPAYLELRSSTEVALRHPPGWVRR